MKKKIKALLSYIVAGSLLALSVCTGTFALESINLDLREQVINAVNGITATSDTTADGVITAVTAVNGVDTAVWKHGFEFIKVLPTDGAYIKLQEEVVGEVKGHDGAVSGVITVNGEFDVPVSLAINHAMNEVVCNEKAEVTITSNTDKYVSAEGYSETADLVVINMSQYSYNIPENYFGAGNNTVKAVIVNSPLTFILSNAFKNMSVLEAVSLKGVQYINSNAFWADQQLKYFDFGSVSNESLKIDLNSFSYTDALQRIYISGYKGIKIGSTFAYNRWKTNQYVLDAEVESVDSGAFSEGHKDTKVFCSSAVSAEKFSGFAAKNVTATDLSGKKLIDFCIEVQKLSVSEDTDAETLKAAIEKKDASFSVQVEKVNGIFKMTLTDAAGRTLIGFINPKAATEAEAEVKSILDNFNYTADTVSADITTAVEEKLIGKFEWIEEFSYTEKVDGAEIYGRNTEEDSYELKATVRGQDSAARGAFAFNGKVFVINKLLEKAVYERIDCTGIQTTDGAGAKDGHNQYDGKSELVIVQGTAGFQHLDGDLKDKDSENATAKDKIKAVIIEKGMNNWNSFAKLNSLKAAVIKQNSSGELGIQQFWNCTSLKYVDVPENTTSFKNSGNGLNQTAFYGCSELKAVLVPQGFDKATFTVGKLGNDYIYGKAVIRFDENNSFSEQAVKAQSVADSAAGKTEAEFAEMAKVLKFDPQTAVDKNYPEFTYSVTITKNGYKYTVSKKAQNKFDTNSDTAVDICDLVKLNAVQGEIMGITLAEIRSELLKR